MKSCDEYQAGIVALFDNEAGDEELQCAAAHLQDCPACRAFCRDLLALRHNWATVPIPSLSPAARQKVLDSIRTGAAASTAGRLRSTSGWFGSGRPARWAAVLVMGVLLLLSIGWNREARDLRQRLQAAEQRVASIQAEDRGKEAQERQQKAISALYFRMAELEERVNRVAPSRRASAGAPAHDRSEKENNL